MSSDTRELTFDDILVLKRIDADTVVERFGSKINASFFEAANMLGRLKLKGYVDIESSPGLSKVWLTDSGNTILKMAEAKAGEELDNLDHSALAAISAGSRTSATIARAMNLRSNDLAFHLNRLLVHELIDFNMRTTGGSWSVEIMLTEHGFHKAGAATGATPQSESFTPAPGSADQKPASGGIFGGIFGGAHSASGGQKKKHASAPARAPAIAEELSPNNLDEPAAKKLTPSELKQMLAAKKGKGTNLKLIAGAIILLILLAVGAYYYVKMRGG